MRHLWEHVKHYWHAAHLVHELLAAWGLVEAIHIAWDFALEHLNMLQSFTGG